MFWKMKIFLLPGLLNKIIGSVGRWSVVIGLVAGGFNNTRPLLPFSIPRSYTYPVLVSTGLPNTFPGKVNFKNPLRLDNSLIVKLSLFKTFSRLKYFSLFSLVSVINISFKLTANPR